jgi:hypothetical protein
MHQNTVGIAFQPLKRALIIGRPPDFWLSSAEEVQKYIARGSRWGTKWTAKVRAWHDRIDLDDKHFAKHINKKSVLSSPR